MFYDVIRQELKNRGISIKQFSDDIGIGEKTFYTWGKNKYTNVYDILNTALYLEMSLDELFQEEYEKHNLILGDRKLYRKGNYRIYKIVKEKKPTLKQAKQKLI